MSVLVLAHPRSPITTDIIKTAHSPFFIAQNDYAFPGHFPDEIIASFGDLTLMPDAHPLLRKNLFLLLGKNPRRDKILLFERFRSGRESFSGFAKGSCCDRLHSSLFLPDQIFERSFLSVK